MSTTQTSARHRPDGARHRTAPGPLLGRHEERQALDNLLDAVRDGLSGALVLTGEAGIGKTRLLDYAAEAAVDLRTVRVSGVESEARLGFAALHRLLLPFLDRLERLPGPQRDVLARRSACAPGRRRTGSWPGLAALTLLADAAVDQPLICLVDDAQWLDRESMEVFGLVGRRLHADDIGLVLAVRDGPAGDRSGTAAFYGLPTLRVTGLSEPDATVLLGSTRSGRPSPLAVGRIVAETGGNPLALIEFAGELTSAVLPLTPLPIGPRLEAHFLRQVRTLPRETQELLLVTSLAPSDDPAVLWRAAAALGLTAQALDPAVNDGILSRERHPAFRHPLIRSAVHAGADPAQRRRVHEALAAATDRGTAPDRRAWHLAEAAVGLDEEVAAELERASERARSRGGYAAQGIFLARAAELTADPHARSARLFAAAQAHLVIGDAGQAQAALGQAVPGLQAPAVAQRLRAAIAWLQGQIQQAPAILLAAVPEAKRFDERLARDMVFEALVAALLTREHTAGVTLDELARTVVDMDWDPALPPSVQDQVVYAITMRITEGYPRAVPWLLRAADALIADDFTEIGMPIALIAYTVAEELWDDQKFKTVVDRLTAFSRERGALHALNVTLHSQAVYALWGGRSTPPRRVSTRPTRSARPSGYPRSGRGTAWNCWPGRAARRRPARLPTSSSTGGADSSATRCLSATRTTHSPSLSLASATTRKRWPGPSTAMRTTAPAKATSCCPTWSKPPSVPVTSRPPRRRLTACPNGRLSPGRPGRSACWPAAAPCRPPTKTSKPSTAKAPISSAAPGSPPNWPAPTSSTASGSAAANGAQRPEPSCAPPTTCSPAWAPKPSPNAPAPNSWPPANTPAAAPLRLTTN